MAVLILLGHFYTAHETTTAVKLRLLSIPIQPSKSQSGNDREMSISPPGHHSTAKIALTTTAKIQQWRADNCEMTTLLLFLAESCNDREIQRRWSDKSEAQHSPPELHEILRRSFQVSLGNHWFMGAWDFLGSLCRKHSMTIEILV